MKKILFILIFAISGQIFAQEQSQWISDYKVALQQSESQNKPILVFVTDNQKTESLELLKKEFFATEDFKAIEAKVILLKLDISNKESYNVRLGIHYLEERNASGLALINSYNDNIGEPLTEINSENIKSFISFLNSKL
ncbi:thioredoxin family protein [Psychroserpens sp. Hel_I_66]|uniref:thioredoxin family protein n=1 Tax=Psychroserpens sp. Hel_I_66 TaxID=1250004 RepID=UPI000647566F|nr:thioredoxin family protein [Psychroserpens sp. Hel_I_66]